MHTKETRNTKKRMRKKDFLQQMLKHATNLQLKKIKQNIILAQEYERTDDRA